jgi:hypothetical protein
MFSRLEEEIGRSENQTHLSVGRRWLYYAGVFVASAIAFGALYVGIRFLDGVSCILENLGNLSLRLSQWYTPARKPPKTDTGSCPIHGQ